MTYPAGLTEVEQHDVDNIVSHVLEKSGSLEQAATVFSIYDRTAGKEGMPWGTPISASSVYVARCQVLQHFYDKRCAKYGPLAWRPLTNSIPSGTPSQEGVSGWPQTRVTSEANTLPTLHSQ